MFWFSVVSCSCEYIIVFGAADVLLRNHFATDDILDAHYDIFKRNKMEKTCASICKLLLGM